MNQNANFAFVFVVCGERKHIETLHFSLKALKRFSDYSIFVVTDSKRNEIPVKHEYILDISTPPELNDHQASIYLKTSLHRILPSGKRYCYLDSDVIALNSECNSVFNYYIAPITFAPDHVTMSYFSPYAVNCNCYENFNSERKKFEDAVAKVIRHPNYPPDYNKKEIRELFSYQKLIISKSLNILKFSFKVLLAFIFGSFQINKEINLDIKNKNWKISSNFTFPVLLLYKKRISKETGYRFSFSKRSWLNKNGDILPVNRCNHLQQALKKTFNIDANLDWQHWNGGVFVFDYQSTLFMDQWHKWTMKIFNDPEWKVRDQGTLIATAHYFNLQNHPTLPEKFNFIADFYKTEIKAGKLKGQFLNNNRSIYPAFIHIYHQWGNTNWDVWKKVLEIV